jgi:hypothetical protein
MAAIFEFDKTMSNGFIHRFMLLQDDEGNFTDIARGGPQSSVMSKHRTPNAIPFARCLARIDGLGLGR